MTNREYLLKIIKPKINVGLKGIDELMDWLEKQFDIKRLSENDISPFQMSLVKNDARAYRKSERNLDFEIVEIVENDKSRSYYRDMREDFPTENITIFIEKNTLFIYVVGSNRIFLGLQIEKGVSQYDYENDTLELMSYLSFIDRLAEMDSV